MFLGSPYGSFPKLGVRLLGSILGSPHFGKLPYHCSLLGVCITWTVLRWGSDFPNGFTVEAPGFPAELNWPMGPFGTC